MDKIKEIVNDPAKLEASFKETWAKIDAKGEGAVSYDDFKTASEAIGKAMGLPKPPQPPTAAEIEAAKKIADPNGTGKINFEGFRALCLAGIEKAKKEGKL